MIETRDAAFWRAVGAHPDVGPNLGGECDLGELVQHPQVIPLAGPFGGFLFLKLDALGRVYDLHAAIMPQGWGKPAAALLKAALGHIEGWQIITVSEVAANWRSRPPRSFGFRPAGAEFDGYRSWVLTRAAWEASPVYRRGEGTCPQP